MNITSGSDAYIAGISLLSERAIKRRLKVLSEDNLIDFQDIPIEENYVSGISNLNIPIISKSKWINGVSAYMTPSQVKTSFRFKFRERIKVSKKLNHCE